MRKRLYRSSGTKVKGKSLHGTVMISKFVGHMKSENGNNTPDNKRKGKTC